MATLGRRGRIYYNSGTYASPTWNNIGLARDVTDNLETTTVDADCRDMGDWEGELAASLKLSIDFEMIHDTTNAVFTAIQNAFFTLSPLEFLILDGPITTSGSKGIRATCTIKKFSESQPLKGIMIDSVSIAPTPSANAPARYTV